MEPLCQFVVPSTTDPRIHDDSGHPDDRGHYACRPGPTTSNTDASGRAWRRRGLVLFIPGLTPANYTLFAQALAETGLHVASLSFNNSIDSISACCAQRGLRCTDPSRPLNLTLAEASLHGLTALAFQRDASRYATHLSELQALLTTIGHGAGPDFVSLAGAEWDFKQFGIQGMQPSTADDWGAIRSSLEMQLGAARRLPAHAIRDDVPMECEVEGPGRLGLRKVLGYHARDRRRGLARLRGGRRRARHRAAGVRPRRRPRHQRNDELQFRAARRLEGGLRLYRWIHGRWEVRPRERVDARRAAPECLGLPSLLRDEHERPRRFWGVVQARSSALTRLE